MEDRVKKSLRIITVTGALLIPMICFIVTVVAWGHLTIDFPNQLVEPHSLDKILCSSSKL
jgi:hypothetical protein